MNPKATVLTLRVDVKPVSLNVYAREHNKKNWVRAKEWHWAVKSALERLYRPAKIKKFPVTITTTAHFKVKRKRDADNYVVANKLITDALRREGVIPDDHGEYVACQIQNTPVLGCDGDFVMVYIEERNGLYI